MEGEETKEATAAVPQSAGAKQGEASKQEALVEKYKRLLSLARSSLEANQAALAQKDTQIAELTRNLEERRAQALRLSRNDDGLEAASIPRSLLRRVDVDDVIWILVEYDDGTSEDGWVCFHSETELNEYIQRVQGVPLVAPHRCLTAAESNKIETEAQAKVDVIVEEFRRFKLRTDIARKQKDAEARQALLRSTSAPGTGTPSSSSSSGNGNSKGDAGGDEESNSDKWRSAYEKVVRENEQLRNRGGDTLLASQWRDRYDALLRERDDVADKLRVLSKTDSLGNRTIEQAFVELKDEYKASCLFLVTLLSFYARLFLPSSSLSRILSHTNLFFISQEYRRRMTNREQQRQQELEDLQSALAKALGAGSLPGSGTGAGAGTGSGAGAPVGGVTWSDGALSPGGGLSSSSGGERVPNTSAPLSEAKHQYIRHMLLQYLSCKEAEVKLHIENALLAIFRYTEAEKALIEERKKSEQISIDDALPGLGSVLFTLGLGSS